jgi:hypothetical protein
MIVTRKDARRIISEQFPGMKFRLSKCTTFIRPIGDPRPSLVVRVLHEQADYSALKIGQIMPDGSIDWNWSV